MINHFRTILLNVSGPRLPESKSPSDIYVPEYVAKVLPDMLVEINHVLFSDCLTDEDTKQKVYQFIRMVEASGLAHVTTAEDTRVTYDTVNDPTFGEYSTSPTILTSVQLLNTVSESKLEQLFSGDTELIRQYAHGNTYVDRLSAIVVAYVYTLGGKYA